MIVVIVSRPVIHGNPYGVVNRLYNVGKIGYSDLVLSPIAHVL